jgi:hypothetical protein
MMTEDFEEVDLGVEEAAAMIVFLLELELDFEDEEELF